MNQVEIATLHGWAMHGGLFDDLAARWPEARWNRIDLPGHGLRRSEPWPERTDALLDGLIERARHGGWLLGWSLGGVLAMQAWLRQPDAFAGLVLIAAAPRFVANDRWPDGADPALIKAMALELADDPEAVLARFLALEVRGGANARDDLHRLRARVRRHGAPSKPALLAALKHLAETDLSDRLGEISAPVLLIGGDHDRLVPPAALEATRKRLPEARLVRISGAAHAPFLTDPDSVAEAMRGFIAERGPAACGCAA